MHETGHSKPVHWDNPEGWDGEGGGFEMGTHVWQKNHHIIVKVISLQLK